MDRIKNREFKSETKYMDRIRIILYTFLYVCMCVCDSIEKENRWIFFLDRIVETSILTQREDVT